MVGVTINVWGRKLILADCDDFTKKYYSTKYGVCKSTYDIKKVLKKLTVF